MCTQTLTHTGYADKYFVCHLSEKVGRKWVLSGKKPGKLTERWYLYLTYGIRFHYNFQLCSVLWGKKTTKKPNKKQTLLTSFYNLGAYTEIAVNRVSFPLHPTILSSVLQHDDLPGGLTQLVWGCTKAQLGELICI